MLKVEEGKFYQDAAGTKYGPMTPHNEPNNPDSERYAAGPLFGVMTEKGPNYLMLWNDRGERFCRSASATDLISEWVLESTADADGWITWSGGERPVGKNEYVEVKVRRGMTLAGLGEHLVWRHDNFSGDIVAYRVVDPKRRVIFEEVHDHTLDAADLIPLPRVPRFGGEEIDIAIQGPGPIIPAGANMVIVDPLGDRLTAADLLHGVKSCIEEHGAHDGDTLLPAKSQRLVISDLMSLVDRAEGRGIRAQSFAERERDLLEANNRYLEEARDARRMLEVMPEQNRRRGITILGMSEYGGAHLGRAEKAESEVKELRHAIMGGEPAPDFAGTIGHGNYLEMARTLHDAVDGGQEAIRQLTIERDAARDIAERETRKVDDLRRIAHGATEQRDRWFSCHTAHQAACTALGQANGELLKRCIDAEDLYANTYNALRSVLPFAESWAEDMVESADAAAEDADNFDIDDKAGLANARRLRDEAREHADKAVAAVDNAKRLLGII